MPDPRDERGGDLDDRVLRPGGGVDARRGRRVDDEVLAHISPAHSENINFFGAIEVDIEGELAQLGPTGYRATAGARNPFLTRLHRRAVGAAESRGPVHRVTGRPGRCDRPRPAPGRRTRPARSTTPGVGTTETGNQ